MKPDIYDKDDLRKAFEAGRAKSKSTGYACGPLSRWETFDDYFDSQVSIKEEDILIPPERVTAPSLNITKNR